MVPSSPTDTAPPLLLLWFKESGRALPWRSNRRDPWAVLVSEVMLQQTQVERVIPRWQAWMQRWPTPTALAADSPAEVLRMWDRLGYPRRALNLHRAAAMVDAEFGGTVPDDYDRLRRLPGVGDYTANAVLAFAYRRRTPVLDTNVRRVHARVFSGRPQVTSAAPTAPERELAAAVLPQDPEQAATLSEAWMELGALRCGARAPMCNACPLATCCAWHRAGNPDAITPRTRRQAAYAGSQRQLRGTILALLRESPGPVPHAAIDPNWDPGKVQDAVRSLVADGLAVTSPAGIMLPD